jgi:CheY-like chemotaxis protein
MPITTIQKAGLEKFGYQVTTSNNALNTLETLRATPHNFDLLITDQTMPDMTGATLAKEALKIRPDLPIILCTGYSETIDETAAKQIGIRHFFMKPVQITTLAQTVRQIFDEQQS